MDQENRADWMAAVQAALSQQDLSRAVSILQQENHTADAEWMCMQGFCQFVMGEFENAEMWWERATRSNPPVPSAVRRLAELKAPAFQNWLKRYSDALQNMERKDYRKALGILQELIEENDGFLKLYQLMGLCYLAVGEGGKAETAWRRGLEIDHSNTALTAYIQSFRDAEKALPVSEAVEHEIPIARFRNISLKPIHLVAGTVCLALLLQGGFVFTRSQYDRQDGNGLQSRMDILADKIAGPETLEVPAEEVMAKTSENREAPEAVSDQEAGQSKEHFYYQKGYNAYLQADYSGARQYLGVVADMATRSYLHREALYYLARTCYLSADYREAEKYYKDYLDKFPNTNYYDDSLFYLGCVYYQLGQLDKTREMFTALRDAHEPGSGYTSTNIYNEMMGR